MDLRIHSIKELKLMAKEKNSPIHIKGVKGNVVISQNQSDGITTHQHDTSPAHSKKKVFYKKILYWIGAASAILTILGYFGIQIKSKEDKKPIVKTSHAKSKIDSTTLPVKSLISQDATKHKIRHLKKKKMPNNENNKPLSVKNVQGDVVISQNQSGGITAHTVVQNFGPSQPEPRHLNSQDEQRLNQLDKYHQLSVLISMSNREANSFGGEIINYLKSRGHDVVVNGYGIMVSSPYADPRYDIQPDGETVSISVPVQQ